MQTRNRQHCNVTCFCFTSRSLLQDILLFSLCLCPVSHLLKCRFVGVLPNLLISQLSPSWFLVFLIRKEIPAVDSDYQSIIFRVDQNSSLLLRKIKLILLFNLMSFPSVHLSICVLWITIVGIYKFVSKQHWRVSWETNHSWEANCCWIAWLTVLTASNELMNLVLRHV